MLTNVVLWRFAILVSSMLAMTAGAATTQPAPARGAATTAPTKAFAAQELEQIVAPIALYPDSLLAQIFMASTYPLEIVQADRWVTAHKDLKGDALTAELEKNTWDPSVKSLVNFPQVLTMMSQQLDWTTKLGDAFIADQAGVMAAVQKLRAKAQAEGNLKSNEQQKVIVEQAPATQTVVVQAEAPPPQIIKIESASPQVVYVPTYNPTVVYGAWPYPAYPPPPPYYPPGYVASRAISFGVGVAVGAAWGYAWGGCNWGGGDVDIDVNRNLNVNQSINRESYSRNIQSRSGSVQGGSRTFQHDPAHRKGVSYRDQATARQYGQTGNADAVRARESYRGRAETGRQQLASGGASQVRDSMGPGAGQQARSPARADSGRTSAANRSAAAPSRSAGSSPQRASAFEGADRGGAAARSSSSRGQASRSASPARASGGSAMRGGGGGRGGGGRR